MAGNGPKIFIPINNGSLDTLKTRLKELRADSKAANKDLQDLKTTGQQVTRDIMERVDKAKAAVKLADREYKEVRFAESSKREALSEARITERIGTKLQRVFGGTFAQKILRGEAIDLSDVVRGARGTEKLVERGLRAAGVKAPGLGMIGLGLQVGAQAVESWKEALETIDQDRKISAKVGRQYGKGLISDSEFEFYQKRYMQSGGETAEKDLKEMQSAAKGITLLKSTKVQEIISKATSRLTSEQGGMGFFESYDGKRAVQRLVDGGELINRVNAAINEKSKTYGNLTKATQDEIKQKVISDAFADLPKEMREKIVATIQEEERKAEEDKEKANKQKPLYMVYQEHREKEIYDLQSAIMDKRIPASPMD